MTLLKTALSAAAFVVGVSALAGQEDNAISVERGSKVYYTYCVSCHGVSGAGDGRRAAKIETLPTNLARSSSPTDYVETVIRKGGEYMGRSRAMPPWEDELSNENIKDVISFLENLKKS